MTAKEKHTRARSGCSVVHYQRLTEFPQSCPAPAELAALPLRQFSVPGAEIRPSLDTASPSQMLRALGLRSLRRSHPSRDPFFKSNTYYK